MNKRVVVLSALAVSASIGFMYAGEFGNPGAVERESSRAPFRAMTNEELFKGHKQDAVEAKAHDIMYAAGAGDFRTVNGWLHDKIPSRLTPVELLLLKDKNGATALIWAADHGRTDVMRLLINVARQEKVLTDMLRASNKEGTTASVGAASNGYTQEVEQLLVQANKAAITADQVKARAKDDNTALASAKGESPRGSYRAMTDEELLEGHKQDAVEAKAHDIFYAAGTGNFKTVNAWLDDKIPSRLTPVELLLLKDKSGSTALNWAASTGHSAIVKLLLAQAEKVGVLAQMLQLRGKDDNTALSWAVRNGRLAIAAILIDKAKQSDMKKSDLWNFVTRENQVMSILMAAAMSGHRGIVQLILKTAYNNRPSDNAFMEFINAQDNLKGRTAIQWAIRFAQGSVKKEKGQHSEREILGVIEEIFKYDGFPTSTVEIASPDKLGKTAIFWAAFAGCEHIVRFFEGVARHRNYDRTKLVAEINAGRELGVSASRVRSPNIEPSAAGSFFPQQNN